MRTSDFFIAVWKYYWQDFWYRILYLFKLASNGSNLLQWFFGRFKRHSWNCHTNLFQKSKPHVFYFEISSFRNPHLDWNAGFSSFVEVQWLHKSSENCGTSHLCKMPRKRWLKEETKFICMRVEKLLATVKRGRIAF